MMPDGAEPCKGFQELLAEADRHIKTIAELRHEISQLQRTIAFFASVIKSGEPWTEQCQHDYDRVVGSKP